MDTITINVYVMSILHDQHLTNADFTKSTFDKIDITYTYISTITYYNWAKTSMLQLTFKQIKTINSSSHTYNTSSQKHS